MTSAWYCEHCGDAQFDEPAYKQKVEGYDGRIELWFCDQCTNDGGY